MVHLINVLEVVLLLNDDDDDDDDAESVDWLSLSFGL
jgi:hypothetical protein